MRANITEIKQSGTERIITIKVFQPAVTRDGEDIVAMFESLHIGKCDLTQV